jgi:hypothetical protein
LEKTRNDRGFFAKNHLNVTPDIYFVPEGVLAADERVDPWLISTNSSA